MSKYENEKTIGLDYTGARYYLQQKDYPKIGKNVQDNLRKTSLTFYYKLFSTI